MRKTATIIGLLTLCGCSTHTGQTGDMIADAAKDGDVLGVGIMSLALPFALIMDVFTLGNTLDEDDMETVATAVEASANTYTASQAQASEAITPHQPAEANTYYTQAPTPGSQDALIPSLKDHALPQCVEYRGNRFYNVCNFDIELTFCIKNPAPFDKAPLTDAGAAYDCAKDQYGLWTIAAGKAMAGTFTGERALYSACRRPYSPVKIKGIAGGPDQYACK